MKKLKEFWTKKTPEKIVYRIVYRNVIKYHELKRLIKYVHVYVLNFAFCILVFRYNISFIDPPLGVFGEIFPSVMIFPSG